MADAWDAFVEQVRTVDARIAGLSAVHVNVMAPRDAVKNVVQKYFREVRPSLSALGIEEDYLAPVDADMQRLLGLANGRNKRTSYVHYLRSVRRGLQELELAREFRLGQRQAVTRPPARSTIERSIIETLEKLAPPAALSYQQALQDLDGVDRWSYRGTAAELRECLREVLDHLAPDEQVQAAKGFQLERGRDKPTQKQKVRHILRTRGVPRNALRAPEDSARLVEELTASLTRSTYERGSISAHIAAARTEISQLKMYVDSVLAELLEIHAN